MAKQKQHGLNHLFAVPSAQTNAALEQAFPEQRETEAAHLVVKDIGRSYGSLPVDRLVPNPFQPRQNFDQQRLLELAASIQEDGMLEPILVRVSPTQSGMYEIAAGERRWRAARIAEQSTVPCEIMDHCPDARMKRIALLENLLREQLSPLELAISYDALLKERNEQGERVYTIRSLGDMLKVGPGHVDDHLAILRVPADVRKVIEDDPDIPVRLIRDLGGIENEDDRGYLIDEVRARNLKTAQIQAILKQVKAQQSGTGSVAAPHMSSSGGKDEEGGQETREKKRKGRDTAQGRAKPSPLVALAVIEQKLKKDHIQLGKTVDRIKEDVADLGPGEKHIVHKYIQQWLDLLQHLADTL